MNTTSLGRRTILAQLALGATSLTALAAYAQQPAGDFPSRPVSLVLPFPPGGVADAVARRLSERLAALWKQPVLVENRPGAGGHLGAAQVARAPADGHTLMITVYDNLVIAKATGAKVGYDVDRDVIPVALATSSATVIIAHPTVPAKDLRELLVYAKANPGKLNFGSNGVGSSYHLALEQLNAAAGTDITHIPYKGSAQVMLDLVAKRLDVTIVSLFLAMPFISDGRLKALAIGSSERSPLLPAVPTVAESGLKDFDISMSLGIFAPSRMSPALVSRINGDIRKTVNETELFNKLKAEGTSAGDLTAEQFGARMQREAASLQRLIKTRNIQIDN